VTLWDFRIERRIDLQSVNLSNVSAGDLDCLLIAMTADSKKQTERAFQTAELFNRDVFAVRSF
jgi:hypothetical protein